MGWKADCPLLGGEAGLAAVQEVTDFNRNALMSEAKANLAWTYTEPGGCDDRSWAPPHKP